MAATIPKILKNPEENMSVFEITKLLLAFVNPKLGKDFYVQQFQEKAKEFYNNRKKDSKHAFQILKKITNYKLALNKKESKIANKVIVNDKVCDENESKKLILEAFEVAHRTKNVLPNPTSNDFPIINLDDFTAIEIIK